MKKYILGGLVIMSLMVGFTAQAEVYDWRNIFRNADDTEDVTAAIPSASLNRFAALGKRYDQGSGIDGGGGGAWYYFKPNQFTIGTSATGGSNNYDISIDLSSMNPLDLGNLGDLLDAKVPITRAINSHALTTNIVLTKSDLNLANIDNTSDANKPVSTATQTALNGKENALTFSSPLSRSVNTISMPVATSSVNGYLSSTDWSTFNSKGSGTVTSVTAGTGLSGGTITGSGTISLPNVGTAGTYGGVTTDAQGRVTAGKRMETYSGTTNGSGVYTVTFGTAYSVAPNIQANLINGTDTQTSRITAISTTGFTVLVRNRTDVVGLLPSYANVSGASVDVLITEK